MIYILIQSVHLELMQIRRLKLEEFASCKTCKTYRSSLYSEKTNMYPKLIPATPIKFEHLYSPGFVILSASDSLTCFIKNPLLFNLQNCNFESKITCWISDKTNGPVLRSFCSTYSMGYSILPPHSIFCLN